MSHHRFTHGGSPRAALVLPLFAGELGATAAQVGMTSAFAVARLVLNVPCGILADRRGHGSLAAVSPWSPPSAARSAASRAS